MDADASAFERIIAGREPQQVPVVVTAEEIVRFLEQRSARAPTCGPRVKLPEPAHRPCCQWSPGQLGAVRQEPYQQAWPNYIQNLRSRATSILPGTLPRLAL
jgi:hypothetical protein